MSRADREMQRVLNIVEEQRVIQEEQRLIQEEQRVKYEEVITLLQEEKQKTASLTTQVHDMRDVHVHGDTEYTDIYAGYADGTATSASSYGSGNSYSSRDSNDYHQECTRFGDSTDCSQEYTGFENSTAWGGNRREW